MATVKFIQAQKFSLSGSGSSIGDVSITLQSMLGIDGVALVTADIGTKGFGTLEPGNGVQEEQISFTGITQNSNGTATLTGVKTVAFISPYTETSGLAKTHAGASTFILSNDAGFYGQILSYVDTALSSGAIPATTLVNGISTLSVAPATAAQPVVVGTNDPRMSTQAEKNYLASVRTTGIPYVVATGTASLLTGTLASSISTLASGTALNVLIPLTVASGVTLNINALGAKTLKKNATVTLASGDLLAGQEASLVFDGTNFQLTSPVNPSFLGLVVSGTTTRNLATASGAQNIPHGLGVLPKKLYLWSGGGAANYGTCVYTSLGTTYWGLANSVLNTSNLQVQYAGAGSEQYTGTITVDATNIIITWTKSGTTGGTATINWDAIA